MPRRAEPKRWATEEVQVKVAEDAAAATTEEAKAEAVTAWACSAADSSSWAARARDRRGSPPRRRWRRGAPRAKARGRRGVGGGAARRGQRDADDGASLAERWTEQGEACTLRHVFGGRCAATGGVGEAFAKDWEEWMEATSARLAKARRKAGGEPWQVEVEVHNQLPLLEQLQLHQIRLRNLPIHHLDKTYLGH